MSLTEKHHALPTHHTLSPSQILLQKAPSCPGSLPVLPSETTPTPTTPARGEQQRDTEGSAGPAVSLSPYTPVCCTHRPARATPFSPRAADVTKHDGQKDTRYSYAFCFTWPKNKQVRAYLCQCVFMCVCGVLPVVTPGTSVGLLSRVHALVAGQVRLRGGGKVTQVTPEWPLTCGHRREREMN